MGQRGNLKKQTELQQTDTITHMSSIRKYKN